LEAYGEASTGTGRITPREVYSMEDLVKVVGVLIASSLFLLGLATLIQLVEQMIREPRASGTRH